MDWIPKSKSLQRCSAKVGDKIYVTGTLGGAAIALQVLKKQISLPLDKQQDLLQSLLRPSSRIKEGIALRDIAHAAIDISDGLAADLGHILQQSNLGATLELSQLPVPSNLTKLMTQQKLWQFALTGGDDYELCFTVAPEMQEEIDKLAKRFKCGFSCIGVIEVQPGLRLIQLDGTPFVIAEKGYQHFAPTL